MSDVDEQSDEQKVIQILQQGYIGSFRAIEKALSKIPASYGANWGSLSLLDQLSQQPNATVGELAKINHVSSGAISIRISDLLKQKLIRLEVNPNDRRRHTVKLTRKGQAVQTTQREEAGRVARLMLEKMDYERICQMHQSFSQLAQILTDTFSEQSKD